MNKRSLNDRVVGKCGNCGGTVTVPSTFHSVLPPVPSCVQCGSTVKEQDNLPKLPMNPRPGMYIDGLGEVT